MRSGGAGLRVEGLTWTPVRRRRPVLDQVDLDFAAGERVIVVGPSGSGKSTLLRALAGLLLTADHGTVDGRVLVDGSTDRTPADVGLLLQDPRGAVVAETIGRDVAFGLENRQVPRDGIWPSVRAALDQAGLDYPLDHSTTALSGGEAQRLALAGALALGSRVLLLDEPTSMLDADAAARVRGSVDRIVSERGTTLVVVEHQLEPWVDLMDRLVVIDAGRVVADGPPRQVLADHGSSLADRGVWVPGLPPPQPIDYPDELVTPTPLGASPAGVVVSAVDIEVVLRSRLVDRRDAVVALHHVGAELRAGRTLAVTGDSGAGKSTLVSVLAGLQRPTVGEVLAATSLATSRGREPWRWRSRDLATRLAWVPQFPEQGVVARTVLDEVLATARAVGRETPTVIARATGLLEALGLRELGAASPYHLSGGEQRRLALASALAHGATGLLLDEPTVGQDRSTWQAVTGVIASAAAAGAAVALATHDRTATDAVADVQLDLSRGRLAS